MKMERTGSYLAYIYLLRVPLLIWLFLVCFPWIAVPKHAPAGSLLRGIFDIAGRPGPLSTLPLFSFFLITFASLLACAAIGVTARLILLDGEERFGAGHVPRRPGVRLMYRVIPLLAPVSMVIGVCVETYTSGADVPWWAAAIGISLGIVVFLILMGPLHNALWERIIVQHAKVQATLSPPKSLWNFAVIAATFVLDLAKLPLVLSPSGYEDPTTHQLRDRHKFAAIQLGLSLFFYALLFAAKKESAPDVEPPVIPTLCLIIVLAMLLCWFLSACTFFFDRFRVPLLLIVCAYGWLVSGLPQGDYFYPAESLPNRQALLAPAQVLQRRAGKPAVLVAASGGGIQAEAWTARVLSGLKQDLEGQSEDFDRSIVLISSVSGGSVGTMFFVDAYRDDGTLPPVGTDLDNYPPVKESEVSSLDDVTWGLVYPDLAWSLAPLFKGMSLYPPHLLNGPNITSDRGTALEHAWMISPTIKSATLAQWQNQTRNGLRPSVIFNATVVESGDRFLLSTSSMGAGPSSEKYDTVGRKVFNEIYPDFDIPIVTAARLSATFPYVTPAARIWRKDVFAKDNHIVDGGYYDNYGVATLVEWLNNALLNTDKKPSRVIIVQIRDSTTGAVKAPSRHGGWFFQALQPLETLESVRGTAQFSRNEVAMDFVMRSGLYSIPIETVEFEFQGGGKDTPPTAPLSWHLTAADKRALHNEWLCPRIVQKRSEFKKKLMQ